MQIVFTDLDGTLLDSARRISDMNRALLEELGGRGIIRVIATGRSLFSFRSLPQRIPADYLIFSTGAGVVDLRSGELLFSANLPRAEAERACRHLQMHRVDFMVHRQVPDNHHFLYWSGSGGRSDFARRIEIYREFARELISLSDLPGEAAQIIAIFAGDVPFFTRVGHGLRGYRITRTTSPLDGRSLWMEIQPSHVGKDMAAAWLCRRLGLERACTLGIGNDYNDVDLLRFTARSYVVGNAPLELRREFPAAPNNDEDGFCHALQQALAL